MIGLICAVLALSGCTRAGASAAQPESAASSAASSADALAADASEPGLTGAGKNPAVQMGAGASTQAGGTGGGAGAAGTVDGASGNGALAATGSVLDAFQDEAQHPPSALENEHYLADTERAVIDAINVERKALGLGELRYNENLTRAARIRSEELCLAKHWDHTRPNGDSWVTVLKQDVPTSFLAAGENLATISYNDEAEYFESDAHWWFTEWKNSPPHYENMIRAEFNEVGVGIYFTVREDGMKVAYATTLFAEIADK